MKTVAIVQSNYIPWSGYFELMQAADEFVLLDTVQFTTNDWRNRNRIRGSTGPCWLTIPIRTSGRFGQSIEAAEVADPRWARRHWQTISQSYAGTAGLRRHGAILEAAFDRASAETRLSAINRLFLRVLADCIGIVTPLLDSAAFPDHPDRVERLIGICRAAGATHYRSGPRARAYIDQERFRRAEIEVIFHDYAAASHEPRLSVIDALLRS